MAQAPPAKLDVFLQNYLADQDFIRITRTDQCVKFAVRDIIV